MRNLIHRIIGWWRRVSLKITAKWESFKSRRKLFLISKGTIFCGVFFGVFTWIFYCYSITVTIANDVYSSTDADTDISLLVKIILSFILSLLVTFLIDKPIHTIRTKKHFPHSHEIVTKRIIEIYSKKTILEGYQDTNKGIDRVIKSPLEYAAETLNGNLAPCFKPNDRYLEEIYSNDVKLIIAVTAENPNLWLDPTLCFYLINCCAVSLLKHKDNNGTKRLIMQDYNSALNYQDEINNQLNSLNKLTKLTWDWASELSEFDFFRFFLYDGKEKDCLENTVFPSLKASHDLFKMKSYFNQRNEIENKLKTDNQLGVFHGHIDFLWDEIAKQNLSGAFRKVIDKRKEEHKPEFLFLFKMDGRNIRSVTVHTFVDGKPYFVEYRESLTSNNGYQIVQSLVSYIAQSIQGTEQYMPAGEYLNTKKSYIEWS